MTLALALRGAAIAIALAALADPVVSFSRSSRPPLTIAILDTGSSDVPSSASTEREAAADAAAAIAGELSSLFDTTIRIHPAHTQAAPCPPDAACVIVSDGTGPRRIGERRAPLAGVRVARAHAPVEIAGVGAIPRTHPRARGIVNAQLVRQLAGNDVTALEIRDEGVTVGRATYRWSSRAVTSASVAIEWTPIADGVRHLVLVARSTEGSRSDAEVRADLAVDVGAARAAVLIHETQPSWSGTFVRRALAADPRFRLLTRAVLGDQTVLQTAAVPLEVRALERAGVAVVVVTAPDELTARELDALDRFARQRGGSVVLLLDRPPVGGLRRLLPLEAERRTEREPVGVGPLRASELVIFRGLDLATRTLATAGADPVVVARSTGQGTIIAVGASDTWRYQLQDDSFTDYWRGLVADAVAVAGDPLLLTLTGSAARPGEPVGVAVEWRASELPADVELRGWLDCGEQRSVIRLWPAGGPGRFEGTLAPPSAGRCLVHAATASSVAASAPLVVHPAVDVPPAVADELSRSILANGGTMVDATDLTPLVSTLRAARSVVPVPAVVHPMRSPWWSIPFAAALAGEWWLRRRRGRR